MHSVHQAGHQYALRRLPASTSQQIDSSARHDAYEAVVPCKRRMITPNSSSTFLQFSDGLAQLDPIIVTNPLPDPSSSAMFTDDKTGIVGLHNMTSATAQPQGVHQVPQMLAAAGNELAPSISFLPSSTRLSPSNPGSPAAPLPAGVLPAILNQSQRGELELARHRAEKAAAGRKAKVPRPIKEQLQVDYDDDDSDLDLTKLTPEERESLISATLANLDDGKDAKRLKRLLRNRVSAQQARERKKQYVTTLEDQVRQHQDHIQELEEQLKAAHSQNSALRKIIQSMQADKLQQAASTDD